MRKNHPMLITCWLRSLQKSLSRRPRHSRRERKRLRSVMALEHIEELEDRTLLAPFALDPGFGDDGKVTTDVHGSGPSSAASLGVALQADGKLIVVGDQAGVGHWEFAIIRYNADGTLDTSFDGDGKATIAFGTSTTNAFATSAVVDAQGRIVVAGTIESDAFNPDTDETYIEYDIGLLRLLADGSPDEDFGDGGRVTIDFGSDTDFGYGVAIDSQGRIVVTGNSLQSETTWDFAVARLTAGGSLDTSFDSDGKVLIDFADDGGGYGVAIDSQDRIVVGGEAWSETGIDLAVARLTVSGALDTSFDGDGRATIDFGGADDHGYGFVAIDAQGRIIIAGRSDQSQNGTGIDFALARLTESGALDTSFDADGKVTIDFGSDFDLGYSVAIDSQGRIVAGGTSGSEFFVQHDFAVARLTESGAFDTSFDADGQATIDYAGHFGDGDFGGTVAIDAQDRIVVAGTTRLIQTDVDFTVARLTGDGTLDTSFGGDGRVTTDVEGSLNNEGRSVVAWQSDGKMIVAGVQHFDSPVDAAFNSGPDIGWDFVVARYNVDGTLDTSFDEDGKVTIDFGGSRDRGLSVAVDPQGRIIVFGTSFHSATGWSIAVVRLTANGARDLDFGGDGKAMVPATFIVAQEGGASMAVDAAGGIVVAAGTGSVTVVFRLTDEGVPDTNFGTGGTLTIPSTQPASPKRPGAMTIDRDGRILIAVRRDTSLGVLRVTPTGALDSSFSGFIEGSPAPGFSDILHDIELDSEGRIVVAGSSTIVGRFFVARLNASGGLDTSFDGDGKVTIDFGSFDFARSVAIDAQDRIIVAGVTGSPPWEDPTSLRDFAVARLTVTGALDTTFDADGDGKITIDFGNSDDVGRSVAIDAQGRIIIAGSSNQFGTGDDIAVARLTSNQPPTADASDSYTVIVGGSVTLDASGSTDPDAGDTLNYAWDLDGDGVYGESGAAAARGAETGINPVFSAAGLDGPTTVTVTLRVSDAQGAVGTATALVDVQAVTVENLQEALPQDPYGPNTIVLESADDGQASAVIDAVNGLAEPEYPVEIILNLGSGEYQGQTVSPPPGVTLIINGAGGTTTFVGASPAFIVTSGTVIVTGVSFVNATDTATILVTGGSLTLRDSLIAETSGGTRAAIEVLGGAVDLGTAADPGGNTFSTVGSGEFIRNAGAAAVPAIGNTFQAGATPVTSPFRIEDGIFHALDAGGGGLVTYADGSVYITAGSGSIQRGINAVAPGGTVHVEGSQFVAFDAGSKLVTIAFAGGATLAQVADEFEPARRSVIVTGTAADDRITFIPGGSAGEIKATVQGLPNGVFRPEARLVAYGLAGSDDLEVSGSITLSAWLDGGAGHDRFKGGAGHDVLLGGVGDDMLVGGGGRDLLVGGTGADRIVGNADDDILIAGSLVFADLDQAIRSIMAEWTSGRDYQTRIANIQGTGSGASHDARLNGSHFLRPGETVVKDAADDKLTGSAGDDWFFFDPELDRATDLHDEAFASELDWILSEV